MFVSEKNKQHQRIFAMKVVDYPMKQLNNLQLAVRFETLVQKAYSLNIHDYKNTKMTEILMMTLTPQLRKKAIKREHHIFPQSENQIYTLGN